jgi:hypothetical protein
MYLFVTEDGYSPIARMNAVCFAFGYWTPNGFETKCTKQSIDSKRLWLWYITISVAGFLDFVHRLEFWKEHKVSETRSVSILRWKGGAYLLSWAHYKQLCQTQPQAGGTPLVGCPQLLIHYILSYPPYRGKVPIPSATWARAEFVNYISKKQLLIYKAIQKEGNTFTCS